MHLTSFRVIELCTALLLALRTRVYRWVSWLPARVWHYRTCRACVAAKLYKARGPIPWYTQSHPLLPSASIRVPVSSASTNIIPSRKANQTTFATAQLSQLYIFCKTHFRIGRVIFDLWHLARVLKNKFWTSLWDEQLEPGRWRPAPTLQLFGRRAVGSTMIRDNNQTENNQTFYLSCSLLDLR